MNARSIGRRSFVRGSAAAACALFTASAFARDVDDPVVATSAGEVRGKSVGGVFAFKGVPYGAPPSGQRRFLPPQPAAPWPGVIDVFDFPAPAAQRSAALGRPGVSSANEDCLRLNVWTSTLEPRAKLPVMVWIHGGGFEVGSSAGARTDGANLAGTRDVVVVSLNHRLNIFGYLYLGAIAGAEYAQSGNAGQLDIVLALRWVQTNIAAFGGDPGCVTVFGQSGGAGKVSTLLAMPAAKGLFHRAIPQSGAMPFVSTRELAQDSAERLLRKLNLKQGEWRTLLQLPTETLLDAYQACDGHEPFTQGERMHWAPVVDGSVLHAQPCEPAAIANAASVPVMVGTVRTELTAFKPPSLISDTNLVEQVNMTVGLSMQDASALVLAYQRNHPGASAYEIYALVVSDRVFRSTSIRFAESRVVHGAAPVYMYRCDWRSNLGSGTALTPHGAEVPFVFRNATSIPNVLPGGDAESLQEQMSRAWIAFARSGNPHHSGIPAWSRFAPSADVTMLFNEKAVAAEHPDELDIKAQNRLPLYQMVRGY